MEGFIRRSKRDDLPEVAWEDKDFETPSGKFEFYSEQAMRNGKSPIAHYSFSSFKKNDDQFLLLTNHGQFNLNSQFNNLDLFNRKHKEPIVYIHPTNALKKGLTNRSWVSVLMNNGEIRLKCILSTKCILPSCWLKPIII